MNICRTCGRPKELHDTKRIPLAFGTMIVKQCLLVLANPDGVDRGEAPRLCADRAEYARRANIYAMEQAEKHDDRAEELADWKKAFAKNREVDEAWAKA